MGTEFDSFPFQDHGDHILSSWLDLDDVYTPTIPQELQNHLFNHETEPISSFPLEESPFFQDLYNFDAAETNENYQSMVAMEPDVCETFLNDYEFGLISPNDHMSPDSINDSWCCDNINTTSSSSPVIPGDVAVMPQGPMVIETNIADETNKSDDEENEDGTDEERKPGTLNCKNLVSERNRRKRLSHQLLSLRALVPNITKMDKRSVLVDALSHLNSIHEETEMLEKELRVQGQKRPKLSELKESSQDNPSGTLRVPRTVATSKPKAHITEIDAEKIEDKRFVVKITCKGEGGAGVGSHVLRVFESLDFEITYTALQQLQPLQVLVTVFIRVKKQERMTEEKLKDCIKNMALKRGLTL